MLDFEIRRIRAGDIAAVAQLHFDLFGKGEEHGYSIAKLGCEFLKQVFYKSNLNNPYFFSDVARCGDITIGFSVYTTQRQYVFRYLAQHQLFRVLWEIMKVIGKRPATILSFLSNFRYLQSEELPGNARVPGWWLVAGVRPEFRTKEFEQQTGIRVAAQMFDHMERVMHEHGCQGWYGVVRPDNVAINLFLQRRGARLVANARAQGMEMNYYVKNLQPSSLSERRISQPIFW